MLEVQSLIPLDVVFSLKLGINCLRKNISPEIAVYYCITVQVP